MEVRGEDNCGLAATEDRGWTAGPAVEDGQGGEETVDVTRRKRARRVRGGRGAALAGYGVWVARPTGGGEASPLQRDYKCAYATRAGERKRTREPQEIALHVSWCLPPFCSRSSKPRQN